jgi:type IV secretory pathway VirJ component
MIRIALLLLALNFALHSNALTDKCKFTSENTETKEVLPQTMIEPSDNLPLTVIASPGNNNMPLAFFISGDRGWAEFDQEVSKILSQKGIAVIGLDSQKYFWKEKQPLETANDIATAVNYYLKTLNRSSFILIGYSFGACVAPFVVNNFQPSVKEKLQSVYCFSPDITGDFEIHVADMLSVQKIEKYDVLKEMGKISAFKPICVFADEEDRTVITHFKNAGLNVIELPGNHHYNNDFLSVAKIVYSNFQNQK